MGQVIQLRHGDSFVLLREMAPETIGAVVCDPPYGLEFMGKEWDKLEVPQSWQMETGFTKPGIGDRTTPWPSFTAGHPQFGTANPTCAVCGGRLRGAKKCSCPQPHEHWKPIGKPKKAPQPGEPDEEGRLQGYVTDIDFKGFVLPRQRIRNIKCPDCGKWIYDHPPRNCTCGGVQRLQLHSMAAWHQAWLQLCFNALKPGGITKVFGATRTFHRLAQAMENAGFELIPGESLEAWAYGSGFPKSLNLAKAIDKHQGVDKTVEAEIQTYLRECREAKGLSKATVDEAVFGGTTRYSWVEGRGGERSDETYLPTPEEWAKLKVVLDLDDRYDAYIEAAIPSREDRFRADGGKAEVIGEEPGDWGYQQDGERWDGTRRITQPASAEAARFEGWGTALKPAWEPFLVGRKPVTP